MLIDRRVLDFILAGMVLEAVVLFALFKRRHRGVAPSALLPNLAAGMCLLLAMRLALAGVSGFLVAGSLLGALIFHLSDLRRQWS